MKNKEGWGKGVGRGGSNRPSDSPFWREVYVFLSKTILAFSRLNIKSRSSRLFFLELYVSPCGGGEGSAFEYIRNSDKRLCFTPYTQPDTHTLPWSNLIFLRTA